MTHFTTDRRTLVKGAAWAVPALSVAAAAPALAASPCTTTYTSVTKTFTYTDALSNEVIVTVTASNVPDTVNAGDTLLPVSTSSSVQISEASLGLLKLVLGNPAQMGGTSNSTSTIAYAGGATTSSTTPLVITRTAVPSSGGITLPATGTGEAGAVPAEAAPGTATITMGNPASTLVGYSASGSENGTFPSNLAKIDGNDYVLHTFTVCGA